MNLTNHIPNRLFGNLDEIFTQAFRNFGPNPVSRIPNAYRYETDESYRLRLDLPGFAKEDVQLSVEDGHLKITAATENEESFRRKFDRVFSLPEDADVNEINAKLENGVLDLEIKKVVETEPATRTIEIK